MIAFLLFASTMVIQGQALIENFEYPSTNKLNFEFLNKNFPCYPEDKKHWGCMSAVPADAETGKQELKIMSNKNLISEQKVQILEGKFLVAPLPLSDEKKSLVEKGDTPAQNQEIRKALSSETESKYWKEKFLQPVQGEIESPYGEKRTLDGKPKKGYHRGLDIGAPEGTPILATNDGKVVLAGEFVEEGNMIMIDHGQGLVSAYLHCSKIEVKKGKMVKKGKEIGKVGSTGVVNTPHLHFGIYIHGTPIDPIYWLKIK